MKRTYKDTMEFWENWWMGKEKGRGTIGKDYATLLAGEHLIRNSIKILDEYHTLNMTRTCKSFLELGCGSGRNLQIFHNEIPDMEYWGVDIMPKEIFIEGISETFPEVLKFSNIVFVDALQFLEGQKERSFDIIFTYGFLMHMPEDSIETLCSEIRRASNKLIITCEVEENEDLGKPQYKWNRDYRNYFGTQTIVRKPIGKSWLTIWKN